MEEHSPITACFCCGARRPRSAMRPFGKSRTGEALTWACERCERPQPVEVIEGGPRLSWGTIATAQRLASQGLGWSPDHVMRVALAHLERQLEARRA